MWSIPISPERLAQSVVAVPPLARRIDGKISEPENKKLIRHLESGGITTMLYGGNAVFYHIALSEYEQTLQMLVESVAASTLVIPSVGPSFGMMMDQALVLKDYAFPTVMVLPQREIADETGIAAGVRAFVNRFGKPIVLYLKHDRWLSPQVVSSLIHDGLVSWIKYAVVRDDPREDLYLKELLDVAPKDIFVSGIGEQPAIVHLKEFGMVGYTSGCVCVNPKLSANMLSSVQNGNWDEAERIRLCFKPLEDLRNQLSPIRVLHRAVDAAGIAVTGELQPLLSELGDHEIEMIRKASETLLKAT